MSDMTSRQRVEAVFNGQKPDRIPNFNILMGFSATQMGKTYREYASDYRVLCEGDILCSEKYGIDMVSAISDPMREAEGFGAVVKMPEDDVPYAPRPLVEDLYDAPSVLHLYDPFNGGRSEDRIKAVEFIKHNAPDYIVGGWVEGAIAEACDLRGINDFLADLACEEEDALHEFLSICCEQAKRFAVAQVKAGADIIGIGDAASSLISPEMFAEFAAPYQKQIVDAVHEAGGRAKLHICGNTSKVIDQMIATGTDIIDVDWMVDLQKVQETVAAYNQSHSRKVCVAGNYDPVAVLLQSDRVRVKEAVKACAGLFDGYYFSSAGCEVPRFTSCENLLAVTEALSERN